MLDLARSSRWTRFWIILSIVGGLYMFYMSYFAFFTANTESIVHPTTVQHRCLWKEGDPVVYHLKTKMGVNYDAGHWFHMAENFMVQHSILRKAGELTNSSNIILNFDEDHFISELNGITRLIVYLGTHNAQSTPKQLYFTHLTFLPWLSSHARVGSSVVLNHHDFNEVQMMDLQHNAEVAKTENRFVKVENYHLWPSASHSTVSSGVAVNSAFRRLQNVVYHLKTKMGVNYDAGHWFHMAENFMVQHSILRKAGELTNSSNIILNFDEDHFISELNGITRLIVYLGTHTQSTPKQLYFTHLTFLPWLSSHARVGSSVVLNHHDFNEVQMMDLQHNAEVAKTENRFVKVENYHLWPSASHSTVSSGVAVNSAFRRLQNNNTSSVSNTSMNLRASVTNANVSTQSTKSTNGVKVSSTSGNTGSIGSSGSSVPNRATSVNSSSLATARNVVANHAHTSGSISTTGIPSATVTTMTTSASASVSVSAGNTIIPQAGYNSHHQVCARYMGSIGGTWPTVQRGHWFPNPGDIESFRDTLRTACPADPQLLKQTAKKKKYKMVLYQRDLSRKLANQEEAVAMLRSKLSESDWDIEILMHKTSRSPCTLMHHLYNTDILLTPHGFQSMLLLFLPRPGLMFEIFPEKYYKRGYGPFGAEYGVTHGGTMSPSTGYYQQLVLPYVSSAYCMESKFCRGFARNQDVILTKHGVNNLLAFIDDHQDKLEVPAPSVDTIISHHSGSKKVEKNSKRDFLFY
eukprot:CAMPEP_0185013308 /NCGR_PEP_ID=MMETSP1098-20130426/98741_1 /TAXON_ID=89044 /ORGANISM="Spumella elongata, Strain CCAP 955/1" /LENGTH=746 /DNA_ID=CAMNT_0027542375 /DNA_START=128 /DNA_END=2368 /DNA_ORIENTATION=-